MALSDHTGSRMPIDGRPVTVNIERHITLLKRKFILALKRKRGVVMDSVICQQD